MKFKILGAFIMVLGMAGAAAAYCPEGTPPRGEWRGDEIRKEDRARFEAMRKIRDELRVELSKEAPNKERARTLFAKELDLRQDFLEQGFRRCIEDHDHSRGRCGWIARNDWRMGYGNGAWLNFVSEMSKDKPNKVRAWEYFAEAEKTNRAIETERFNAMLDNPDGRRGWHCGPMDGERRAPRCPGEEGRFHGEYERGPRHRAPRCLDGPAY